MEGLSFSRQFRQQEFPSLLQQLPENARPRLPGKRQPNKKGRLLAVRCPFLSLERIGQRLAALLRGFKRRPLRPSLTCLAFRRPNHSDARQFLQRVVHVRPRNRRPVANFPPLQFQVCLVAVHRPLREQAEHYQVRRCQLLLPLRPRPSRNSCRQPQSPARHGGLLREPLSTRLTSIRSMCLCVVFSFHFRSSSFAFCSCDFLFLLQYHHWHSSAGSRGFRACATAAQKVSSTQGSWRCPVFRLSLSYIFSGSCFASWETLRMPSISKSRSMAGPTEIKCESCLIAAMRISLTSLYSNRSLNRTSPVNTNPVRTSLNETSRTVKEKIAHARHRPRRPGHLFRIYRFHRRSIPIAGEKFHERQTHHAGSAGQGNRAAHPFLGGPPRLRQDCRSPRR